MTSGIERLRSAFRPGRPALVAYVPIGDPEAFDARTLDRYRDAGVAVLEIGIPTRDPWLDGAEVTGSMRRALDAGTTLASITATLGIWRAGHAGRGNATPAIVWFSYPDLPLEALAPAAQVTAIDAILMLEPWRHPAGAALQGALAALGIAACAFLPWSPTDRDRGPARAATGYLMVQARPGVTGPGGASADPSPHVRDARDFNPAAPVVAGFGVQDPGSVRTLLRSGVDGVVVGSACIRAARDGGPDGLGAYLASLVQAMRPEPAA